MKNKQLVPRVRFKRFSEDWKEDILESFGKFSKGRGYSKSDLKEKGHPIILYGRLYTNYKTSIIEVDTFVEEDDNSVKSVKGDIIIPSSGETSLDIARASVVEKDNIILGGDLNIIKLNNKINPTFLALDISNGRQQRELIKKAQGKSVVHLYNEDIKTVKMIFPTYEEQEKIGDFFSKLDDIIELSEKELESYKDYKKAMHQKMFPKKGEKTPEIRLNGFSGDWEEKKLGEVGILSAGGDIDKSSLVKNGKYPVLANALTNDGIVGYYNSYKEIAPAVTITGRGEVGKAKARYENFTAVVRLIVLKPFSEYNVGFLESSINMQNIFVESTGVPQLTIPQVKNYKIKLPSLQEQEKIDSFFKKLDDLIEKQEHELENYKSFKKAMLQKMFV